MNYENWISYRYLSSSKGRFLSFLNFVSIFGVAIGVMALIVVMGVMTGFGNNLRDKIIGTSPHIMVEKETGVEDYDKIVSELRGIEGVVGAAAYVQGNIFMEHNGQAMGLVMRGIEPGNETKVTKVDEYLIEGNLESLDSEGIIIGYELARYYGFNLGEEVTLIAPSSGLAGGGWRHNFKIVGIFKSGMVDYDMNLVLANIHKAQEMFNLQSNRSTGIGLRLSDPYKAKDVKEKVFEALGFSFLTKTWMDINRNLFEALKLEKLGLFIILTFMIVIASFNIISTLIVTVTTKVQDIGILKSVGVPNGSIMKIFTKLGMYIGTVGTFFGTVAGLGICYVLKNYIKVPAEIYSIEYVPVDLQLVDMLMIVSAALVITFFASIYPAMKAANLQPVAALRYE